MEILSLILDPEITIDWILKQKFNNMNRKFNFNEKNNIMSENINNTSKGEFIKYIALSAIRNLPTDDHI